MVKQKGLWFYSLLIIVSTFVSIVRIQDGHNWGCDFSEYIAQAESIINGSMEAQVQANTFMMTHSNAPAGPSAYPWGYPLLLAPIILLFGRNYYAMKAINVISFSASIVLVNYIIEKKTNKIYAGIASLVMLFSPAYLRMMDNVLSDIPFLFISLLTFYFIDQLYKNEDGQIKRSIAVAILSFFSYFIRTNGIVCILTVAFLDSLLVIINHVKFCERFRERLSIGKQKIIAHAILYIVYGSLCMCVKWIFPSGNSGYDLFFRDFGWNSILSNIIGYAKSMKDFFGFSGMISTGLVVIVFLFLIVGYILLFFDELPIIVYMLGLIAMVVLYPANQGVRYIFPIYPCMIILIAIVNYRMGVHIGKKGRVLQYVCVGAVICALAFNAMAFAEKRILSKENYDTNTSLSVEAVGAYTWIKENTDSEAIIVFSKPRVLWLNTGRLSISVDETNADALYDADYVLLRKDEYTIVNEIVNVFEKSKKIFENEGFTIYKNK